MGEKGAYDSQGKTKPQDARTRSGLLVIGFCFGLLFGVVVSQRLYIEANRPASSIPVTHPLPAEAAKEGAGASRALASGAATASVCKKVGGNCELEAYLMKIAPQREVLVAISNYNLVQWGSMLDDWITNVQKSKVPNYMVLAIDAQLHDYLNAKNVQNFFLQATIADSQKGTGDNHAVSALKFGILREFIKLGWSVLLSDVDIITLSNPFDHLYRDRDIEGMTDGFDDATAYGFVTGIDDETMGWARYAQAIQHMNLNSGLFYVRANDNTEELMRRLADRLSKTKYWDQTAFNEEIFFLSHGDKDYVPISVRVMDIWTFMNSKVFFKKWRHMQPAPSKPVMVHVNYHPDKPERLKGMAKFFETGDRAAIMHFPGGSEPGSR